MGLRYGASILRTRNSLFGGDSLRPRLALADRMRDKLFLLLVFLNTVIVSLSTHSVHRKQGLVSMTNARMILLVRDRNAVTCQLLQVATNRRNCFQDKPSTKSHK